MTPANSQQIRWTIADLEGFPDNGNRYEIIDGELFVTRAPHWNHQDIQVLFMPNCGFGLNKVALVEQDFLLALFSLKLILSFQM